VKRKLLPALFLLVAVSAAGFFLYDYLKTQEVPDDRQGRIKGETTTSSKIAVENKIKSVTEKGDGSYEVLYEYVIANTFADKKLNRITAIADLTAAYDSHEYQVLSLTSPRFDVLGTFDGKTQKSMLVGTNSLNAKTSGIINLKVRVFPEKDESSFENSVQVYAVLSGMPSANANADNKEKQNTSANDSKNEGKSKNNSQQNKPGNTSTNSPGEKDNKDADKSKDKTKTGTSNKKEYVYKPDAAGSAASMFNLEFADELLPDDAVAEVDSGEEVAVDDMPTPKTPTAQPPQANEPKPVVEVINSSGYKAVLAITTDIATNSPNINNGEGEVSGVSDGLASSGLSIKSASFYGIFVIGLLSLFNLDKIYMNKSKFGRL